MAGAEITLYLYYVFLLNGYTWKCSYKFDNNIAVWGQKDAFGPVGRQYLEDLASDKFFFMIELATCEEIMSEFCVYIMRNLR